MSRGALTVWFSRQHPRAWDEFGRPRSVTGRSALHRAAATAGCSTRDGCLIAFETSGHRCQRCGDRWSVSHTVSATAVARSVFPVGIDIEDRRLRPAALRELDRLTGNRNSTIVEWTRAEALLKAQGRADRRPAAGALAVPQSETGRWQRASSRPWWVYTFEVQEHVVSVAGLSRPRRFSLRLFPLDPPAPTAPTAR